MEFFDMLINQFANDPQAMAEWMQPRFASDPTGGMAPPNSPQPAAGTPPPPAPQQEIPPVSTTDQAPGGLPGNNRFALSPDMIKALMAAMGQGQPQRPQMMGAPAAARPGMPSIRPPLGSMMPGGPGVPGARRGF